MRRVSDSSTAQYFKNSNMKKFSVAALFVLALISLNACRKVVGEGPVVTETRSTGEFLGIKFEVPGEMIYVPGDGYKVEIKAQQNIINVIETAIVNRELKVRVRNNVNLRSHEDIRVTVTAPPVLSLGLSGSAKISALQSFSPENINLFISGSGSIFINEINTDHLDASISGSGKIEILRGSANVEDFSISGSGEIEALGFPAKKAHTQISGSGKISVKVSEELNNKISGSGSVYYLGTPVVNSSISGNGKVVQLQE